MNYERWKRLMKAFSLDHNKNTWEALIKAYSEKHRYYHTAEHIIATLSHFDKIVNLANRAEEIELSLWFHDAVYNPLSTTNEQDSANWIVKFLSENNVSKEVISRVCQLIMATGHSAQSYCQDESLIVDIDLTILGAPESIYTKFELAIRKEYKLIPFFIYKKKRKSILNDFLGRDRIYQNEYFYKKLETQARLNLGNAISSQLI